MLPAEAEGLHAGRVPGRLAAMLTRIRPQGLLSRVLGSAARQSFGSLADQAVVSGTRFAVTILVGRLAGVEELGLYAIGFSIVVLVNVVQESLLMSPYAVLGRRERPASQRRFAGSIFVLSLGLGLVASGALGAFSFLALLADSQGTALMGAVLAAIIPCVLLQNFARKICFAHFRIGSALLLDFGVAVIQLSAIALMATVSSLSAVTALAAMGVGAALTGIAWLPGNWHLLDIRRRRVMPQLSRNWTFGRWILGAQQVATLSGSVVLWIISTLAGLSAAGIFAACSIVITAANPLLLGLANVLEPRTATSFAAGRIDELLASVHWTTVMTGSALAAYWLGLLIFGDGFLAWIFDNPQLLGQAHLIMLLATVILLRGLILGRSLALRALGLPRHNFNASLIDLSITVISAYPLISQFGAVGGGYCVLMGVLAGTLMRLWHFSREMRVLRDNRMSLA